MLSPNNDDEDDGNVAETSMSTYADNFSILSRLSSRSSLIGPSKFNVSVQLLDRTDKHSFEYKKNVIGQNVLDDICKIANIAEKEYFGLQYEDNKFRYWVDLSKALSKQFHRKAVSLRLRVRFYPTDLSCVKEAVTRYHLFVQVHRDLLHGRLICSPNESAQLGALILQASIGDYDAETMGIDADYVSGYALVARQSQKIEERIAEVHKELRGLSTEEAEKEFLEVASKLETYGFDPYVVKNMGQCQEVTIGATSHGILLFVRGQKVHSIKWADIHKVDYLGKQLTITPSKDYLANFAKKSSDNDESADVHNTSLNSSLFDSAEVNGKTKSKKEQLKLICPSATFAKHLWRHILAQQVFFTEDQANKVKPKFSKPKIPLFSRGSTFRCPTTRLLHELEQDNSLPRPEADVSFERYPLKKYQPRSVDEPWNASRSSSTQNSLERGAKLAVNNAVENSLGTAQDVAGTSSLTAAEDSCDGNSQSFLDKTTNTTANGISPHSNSTLPAVAHPEEIREAMANGSLNSFGHANSSLKNGTSNGYLINQNGYAEDKSAVQTGTGSAVATVSLFVGVFLIILTLAFLVAYFFYPDSLRNIELPALRIPLPSNTLPAWFVRRQ